MGIVVLPFRCGLEDTDNLKSTGLPLVVLDMLRKELPDLANSQVLMVRFVKETLFLPKSLGW